MILGIKECRSDEEGDYRCTISNEHGEAEFEFKFFVTVEGGMDFRAMLMKRKVKQKKVVVKKIEWIEKPVDLSVQQGKCDQVVFTARLSEKEKKGKWYIRNNVSGLKIAFLKCNFREHCDFRTRTRTSGQPTTE